jgi:hypothetical protein
MEYVQLKVFSCQNLEVNEEEVNPDDKELVKHTIIVPIVE